MRVHKKKLGGRSYANYPEEKLQECLEAIKNKTMTQRRAADFYGIPRSTLKNKLKGCHGKSYGRPPIFSDQSKSISLSDIDADGKSIKKAKKQRNNVSDDSPSSFSEEPDEAVVETPKKVQSKKLKRKVNEVSSSSSEGEESDVSLHSELSREEYKVNDFVVVNYNGSKYPGKIIQIGENEVEVDCFEKVMKCWRLPQKPDRSFYAWKDILFQIEKPIESKRNQYRVPELEEQVYR